MPLLCSSEAAAISCMICVTLATASTIVLMVFPAVATSSDPRSINLTDSLIKPSISFAAWALRLASVRTSLATTANPRPCSPARAASTAAFSARIFVWKAILLMTAVISEIFFELVEIAPIVFTTPETVCPPSLALIEASCASLLA